MKAPKVSIIIAIVIAGGLALAFIANYMARKSSQDTIINRPIIKKENPVEIGELKTEPVQAALPKEEKRIVPAEEVIFQEKPGQEVEPESEMPVLEVEKVEEAVSFEAPQPAPPSQPSSDTPPPVSVPTVHEETAAPVATGALPIFTPVTSTTGPVPSSSQSSLPISAASGTTSQSAQGIASFIPRQSPTGPAASKESAPAQTLPSFAPVTNTTGPVKAENK